MKPQGKKSLPSDAPKVRFRFVTSARDLSGCPEDTRPEIALIGRSNSGKSSFINGMAHERVAMTSSSPGKTRLLNFYAVGDRYRFVDMPGYGYSVRSGDEHHGWKAMAETYLSSRANLCGLLLVVDIRREWSEDEAAFVEWLRPIQLPVALVLTKIDKLSRSETEKRRQMFLKKSGLSHVFVTSALKKTGHAEVEEFVFRNWVRTRGGR